MIWNDHSRDVPAGAHAFLGASKHSWTEKEEADILTAFKNSYSTTMGTEVHEIASFMINKKIRLAKTDRKLIFFELLKNGLPRFVIQTEKIIETVMPFINDAIGFDMQSEQPLYFSRWAFGTADAISFNNNMLRIHDLKTGVSPASFRQLEIYAAFFCLEYQADPRKIDIELRIYQTGEVKIYEPDKVYIFELMSKIKQTSKALDELFNQ